MQILADAVTSSTVVVPTREALVHDRGVRSYAGRPGRHAKNVGVQFVHAPELVGRVHVRLVVRHSVGCELARDLPLADARMRSVAPHPAAVQVAGIGATLAFLATEEGEERDAEDVVDTTSTRTHRVAVTAFFVIFVAEWGDLTQVLTANLAAHYHDALSVGVGSSVALLIVAAIAVVSGQGLVRIMPGTLLRRITGVACVVFMLLALVAAIRG